MRQVRHPLVDRDIVAIAEHIVDTTDGDIAAAERRLDEIDALLNDIAGNPFSGVRLSGPLEGWLVRHGGRGYRITIVFRPDADCLYIALVAFGGQDWLTRGSARLERTDAQLAENAAQQAKADARLAKTDSKLDRLAEMYGLEKTPNEVATEFFCNSLKTDPVLGGVRFDFVDMNMTRSRAGVADHFHLLLVNGGAVFVVEVKYKAHGKDLRRLLDDKAANFRHLFPEYADRKHRLVLAAFHVHDELKRAALEQGVTVLQRKGDVIESAAA